MKTIVVTGGSAGVGLAIADRFARGGWQVAILARDEARLAEAEVLIRAHDVVALAISVDVADAEAVFSAADRIERELGPIDVWVNNAMSTVVAPAHEITPAEYARVTETTYLSQVHGTLAALRHMRERDRGTIVQISSGLAIRPAPLQAAYCGAKAAVGGFTDALRAELIAERCKVALSLVYLPGVNTPQPVWARNRSGFEQVIPQPVDPRLCAEAVWATAHDSQREIWVGRTTAMMAIGRRVAPSYSDRKAAAMIEQQQGAPMPPREGNLDGAVAGAARIDGPETTQVSNLPDEFFTSRGRNMLLAVVALGLMGTGAVASLGASRALRKLLR
jgi:NAD(P)-dependent dehydrogenase (short-subunit alcohol dehydrogenase family)